MAQYRVEVSVSDNGKVTLFLVDKETDETVTVRYLDSNHNLDVIAEKAARLLAQYQC